MDIKALDKALQELEKRRSELTLLDYSSPKYDDLEEQLHDLEDDFQDQFGEYLEGILQTVHDKHCPDTDVLLPIAYMGDGILVEADAYPQKEVRLILQANPPKILLQLGKDKKETVWVAS
jgi:hypothetical protein